MRLLIFGKNGQVARSFHDLHNGSRRIIQTAGRPKFDVTNSESVTNAIGEFRPDFVVNAAAYTAVDKAEEDRGVAFAVNSEGAANIAKATADTGVPIIHISTDYVFDGSKKSAYSESDLPNPQGVYGATKLAGEENVAKYNPSHIILRTAWVYSAYGSNFLKTMLRLGEDRSEISVVSDQLGCPTEASDVALAIVDVCEHLNKNPDFREFGVFHYCGPEGMCWADFARRVFDASRKIGGPDARINHITTADYPTAAKRPSNSCLDTSKFFGSFFHDQPSVQTSVAASVRKLLSA